MTTEEITTGRLTTMRQEETTTGRLASLAPEWSITGGWTTMLPEETPLQEDMHIPDQKR